MEKQLDIVKYLDSTYLKTANEAGITELENKAIVLLFIDEAIIAEFACIMIRPKFVLIAKERIAQTKSKLKIGTVIDFPFGNNTTAQKLIEAESALRDGAYDIDFVCDYNAFKRGSFEKFDNDILQGTKIVLARKRIVKWIIETGALSRDEIRNISKRITQIVEENFPAQQKKVFIKTSTGYYGGYGASVKDLKIIKSVVGNLQIKASGGISDLKGCYNMIRAGATRIGSSKALLIYNESKEK
jgi:deoxyribose-phosphate aldolase